jgi:mono/diheme cytochrome c family protein
MTAVAKRMSLRRPPSLHDPRIRALTDAEIHDIVVHGYGLMPAYGARMSATDTWAVVGYVRALQLSQNANLDQLPERVRAQGLQALP